ncbi:MAG: hypothetical protein IPO27_07255 [Bacteroidetes bacterium]|nr:hypothetical protein [Bacteroidota bacterium]
MVKAKSYVCVTFICAGSALSSSVVALVPPGVPVPSPLIALSAGEFGAPPASLFGSLSSGESISL